MGKARGGWNTKVHGVAGEELPALAVALAPGQVQDGMEGWKLLLAQGRRPEPVYRLMARAYERDATRQLAKELGYQPVVPPQRRRKDPWE